MRVLVIGAGLSGLGVARLLKSHNYDVTLCNRSDFEGREALEAMGIVCILNDDVSNNDGSFDMAVKAPGIKPDHPLAASFDFCYNEIECAAQFSPQASYYALSGTNGKTTTATLLHQMLLQKNDNALLAGNVGYALSEAVYRDGDSKRDVALEISAFQMAGTKQFHPKVYALMNLAPDHLDHYGDVERYYHDKFILADRCDIFIRNSDDPMIMAHPVKEGIQVIDISLNKSADVYLEAGKIMYHDTALFEVKNLKLMGRHNLMNASFASLMAHLAHVSSDGIQRVIQSFSGVEHRCEFVKELKGVSYYNDSKATNPESTQVCLEGLPPSIILLAGGSQKHISFDLLKQYTSKLKHVYVFGESAQDLMAVFPQATLVETMQEALVLAHNIAQDGDSVVLSPACASYDQFKNFEERGMIFKDLVHKL